MAEFSFWFVIGLTVLSAAIVVLSNQLIYSAMALLVTLFGVAGIYVFLWADFIAGVQLLVYSNPVVLLLHMRCLSYATLILSYIFLHLLR